MEEKTISLNSPKAWFLAARPKTLAGAAVPVMIGWALSYGAETDRLFNWIPALLCMLFAFIMQIDANFINDYFDFKRGNDDETRLGPRRACAMGWVTPHAMCIAIVLTTLFACAAGLPLVYYGGLEILLVGAACVVFCFLYTTCLSYLGLGDVLVLVFFGIVPVCVICYILTGEVPPHTVIASLGCGFVIDTLLLINNYRDIDNDRRKGKRTLTVLLGARGGRLAYLFSGCIATFLGMLVLWNCDVPTVFLPLIYLAFHYMTYRRMVRINKGKALNMILGQTARNMFIYGLIMSAGLIMAALW